ncbi:MAG: glycosyltransferase [Chloroflexi bacterium]|nr:glycosyltransferase [Chloroflexota bacterium]
MNAAPLTLSPVDPSVKLAVVLGTYNRLDSLKICIDSIVAQTRTPTIVYVSDAGSTDGTVEYLQSIASDRLVPILVGRKLGQARAYNDVFMALTTPYVVWISDDNKIVNHGLDRAVDILDHMPKVGMVGVKVKDVEGPFTEAPYLGAVSSIGILNVNQGMLRTHALQQVGGFSERFRDYGIDPDLTAKILFDGWDVAYTKAVGIHHYRAWADGSAASGEQRARQLGYVNLYAEKWGQYAPPDLLWKARKKAWGAFQKATGLRINSSRTILGLNGRDWCNLLTGRYICLLDALQNRRRPYHLLQRAPRWSRPLPPDPA